jgi:hypothetical protein
MSNDSIAATFPVISGDNDDWLAFAACADLPLEAFFVQAGHVIDEDVLNVCRGCIVRVDCLRHAYDEKLNVTSGYFGGMSPGQRREMNLEQAIEYCRTDTVEVETGSVEDTDDGYGPVIYS